MQNFKHPELGEIRGIEINGEPWLVGKDVAAALGYSDLNKAIAMHVDEDDKLNDKTALNLGQRGGWLINESGLYSLIFSSKLPNAKEVKSWIKRDVLPILREYNNPAKSDDSKSESIKNTPDFDKKCAIQAFENPEFGQVRMLEEDGKVLFCGRDVAVALGYSNPNDALTRHCRGIVKREGVSFTTNQYGATSEQTVEMSFIPEGDVYRLIVRSNLPSAEKFECWVFDEVLPSIRKTGMYISSPQYDVGALSPELQLAKTLLESLVRTELEQKRQAAEQERIAQEQTRQAEEQKRMADEQERQAAEQKRQAQEQEQHMEALKTVDRKLEDIRDIVVIHPETWRKDCHRLVAAIAQKRGGANAYRDTNAEIFKLLEDRAHVSLKRRLKNRRGRMAEKGVAKSKRDKLNQMDIIEEDAKLTEIYIGIVKEMCVQYEVSPSVLEEAQSA